MSDTPFIAETEPTRAPRIDIAPDADIAGMMHRAARGARWAQAAMRGLAFEQFNRGVVSWSHAVYVAEVWARLAAAHGCADDRLKLAAALICASGVANDDGKRLDAIDYQAEALAILEDMARDGCEDAAQWLQATADAVTPEALQLAEAMLRESETRRAAPFLSSAPGEG